MDYSFTLQEIEQQLNLLGIEKVEEHHLIKLKKDLDRLILTEKLTPHNDGNDDDDDDSVSASVTGSRDDDVEKLLCDHQSNEASIDYENNYTGSRRKCHNSHKHTKNYCENFNSNNVILNKGDGDDDDEDDDDSTIRSDLADSNSSKSCSTAASVANSSGFENLDFNEKRSSKSANQFIICKHGKRIQWNPSDNKQPNFTQLSSFRDDNSCSSPTSTITTNSRDRNRLKSINQGSNVKRNGYSSRSAHFHDDPVNQVHVCTNSNLKTQRPGSITNPCQHSHSHLNSNQINNDNQLHRNHNSLVRRRPRHDPVSNYHAYRRSWSMHSIPGENARSSLRWNVKSAMMHREIPVLQRNFSEIVRLLGPDAIRYLNKERQKHLNNLHLEYVPPTSKKHPSLLSRQTSARSYNSGSSSASSSSGFNQPLSARY